MKITNATPLFVVDAIEPALALWTGPMAYEKKVEVPHGGRAGFVLLERDGRAVMMQTRASLAEDLPAIAKLGATCLLYVDVASLDDALREARDAEVLVPPRTTFYGAREAFVRDGAGNVVAFAEHSG